LGDRRWFESNFTHICYNVLKKPLNHNLLLNCKKKKLYFKTNVFLNPYPIVFYVLVIFCMVSPKIIDYSSAFSGVFFRDDYHSIFNNIIFA
jgi:hypothetical protein